MNNWVLGGSATIVVVCVVLLLFLRFVYWRRRNFCKTYRTVHRGRLADGFHGAELQLYEQSMHLWRRMYNALGVALTVPVGFTAGIAIRHIDEMADGGIAGVIFGSIYLFLFSFFWLSPVEEEAERWKEE